MPVYEVSTDTALIGIEALTRHLCGDEGFSEDTHPTSAEVTQFEGMAYYKIAAKLAENGYSITQTDAEVLGFLEKLEILETVVLIELAYPVTGSDDENERYDAFSAMLTSLYTILDGRALAVLGASQTSTPSLNVAATGISYDDKNTVNSDSDFVRHRFHRGQHSSIPTPGNITLVEK